jgi:hypothetical protein
VVVGGADDVAGEMCACGTGATVGRALIVTNAVTARATAATTDRTAT